MHRLAMSLLAVLLVYSSCAGDDARLDKPVTLAVKGEALADIMPMIEEQTGVRLKVAHDIADQKATVFVDDKPLKEIMAGLNTAFGFTWSYTDFKGERSYSLSMPVKVRRQREDWRKQALDKAWPDFEAEMKRLADMPVKSVEELDELIKQTEDVDEQTPAPAFKVDGYDWDRRKRAAARLYQTFSPSLRKTLRDGMTICYDLDSSEPGWKIPAELQDEFRQNLVVYQAWGVGGEEDKFPPRQEYDSLGIEMSVLPSPEKFSVEVYERHGKCVPNAGGYVFRIFEKLLGRIVPLPKNSLPRKADDPILGGKVSYTEKELEEEAAVPKSEPWRTGTYINRSDLLALLHKKLGLQIISDHYSHWFRWEGAEKRSLKSILESLERFPGYRFKLKDPDKLEEWYLAMLTEENPAADWGWDAKFLYMRAANPMKMDSREIPNRILRRWQVASRAGTLGLTQMAEIHTLAEGQFDMLRENLQGLGIEVWRGDIDSANPALRLYGLLSLSQQKLMLDGLLSTWAFNADQRSALLDLIPNAGDPSVRRGCRVGIYDKAGRRVDKPDSDVIAYPDSVRLEAGERKEYFSISGGPIGAATLEEALKSFGSEYERSMLRKCTSTPYEMTLTFADGTESKKKFSIRTYTPVQLSPKS